MSVHALNEYFPGAANNAGGGNYVDWRSRLLSQRGAVLATEVRNNAAQFSRWTVEAILAGADQLKLGFVSRNTPLTPQKGHTILGTQFCKPLEFAQQVNVDMTQCWGVVKSLVDIFLNMDDGRFVILKDPNQPKVRIYQLSSATDIAGFKPAELDFFQ